MELTTEKFNSLLVKELQPLKNYALSLTHDMEETKDLVQETLLKAFTYQTKFQDGTNLRGWLYTILKNSFINKYRRNIKRNTFLDSTDNTFFIDSGVNTLQNDAEEKFMKKDLNEAINALNDDLKITFQLNAEGFKYHEIAEQLNIPIGTVKTRIFVAKRFLRKKLQSYGEAFEVSA